jgi:uncharacterized phage protein (TIGR01671 family)
VKNIKIRYIVRNQDGHVYSVEPLGIEGIECNDIRPYTDKHWEEIVDRNLFTGLKDKNGKEIYEGDILRYKSGFYGFAGQLLISEVEWDSAFCGFRPFCDYSSEYDDLVKDPEVIGNIYENPELLEGK